MNDGDSPDPHLTERLRLAEDELVRLAKDLHENFSGDSELELFSAALSQAKFSDRQIHDLAQTLFNLHGRRILVAFAILGVERLIANENAAAMHYQRVLRAMAAIGTPSRSPMNGCIEISLFLRAACLARARFVRSMSVSNPSPLVVVGQFKIGRVGI